MRALGAPIRASGIHHRACIQTAHALNLGADARTKNMAPFLPSSLSGTRVGLLATGAAQQNDLALLFQTRMSAPCACDVGGLLQARFPNSHSSNYVATDDLFCKDCTSVAQASRNCTSNYVWGLVQGGVGDSQHVVAQAAWMFNLRICILEPLDDADTLFEGHRSDPNECLSISAVLFNYFDHIGRC